MDEMGGVVMTIRGERGATASSQSNQYNLYAKGLSVLKGWTVKVTCNNL